MSALAGVGGGMLAAVRAAAPTVAAAVGGVGATVLRRGLRWSVETETHHTYKSVDEIIDEKKIHDSLEATKKYAKDTVRVEEILEAARERSFLRHHDTKAGEYVQGLTVEECATLLNVDAYDKDMMQKIYDTALAIKERIYGNRIVLFAPLYIANYCVNSCTYCAFRGANKSIERTMLTKDQIIEEVEALQRQGHRRLLLLTGESPKYTFDSFLDAVNTVSSVHTEPCGNIRRINVEIPALSVSDMKRLKATDKIGTYTLFQETYHRDTFKKMHPTGPKSDYNHRVLAHDRAMRGGIDDVGIGTLFGLYDYRFEVLAMLQHANHLEAEYHAGPHTISVPRMRPAAGAETSVNPPYPVDDENMKKLVAIIRIAVPYTGMILSTRESAEMRSQLLKLGISQMSAGSRTDVGAYHRESSKETESSLGRLSGQFSLYDHRTTAETVKGLMEEGFVPSWCTACYRKGRTGEAFMKIAKSGNIHNFCHPNSLLTLQEFLDDYGDDELKKLGADVIARERDTDLSEGAKRVLGRKLKKVQEGARDVYL